MKDRNRDRPYQQGGDRIGALLDSLAAQTAEHQVLVVDNGSSDGTREVLARYPERRGRSGSEQNIGFGRAVNLAAQRADGEALVLVNDDCVCDPGFVEQRSWRRSTTADVVDGSRGDARSRRRD